MSNGGEYSCRFEGMSSGVAYDGQVQTIECGATQTGKRGNLFQALYSQESSRRPFRTNEEIFTRNSSIGDGVPQQSVRLDHPGAVIQLLNVLSVRPLSAQGPNRMLLDSPGE